MARIFTIAVLTLMAVLVGYSAASWWPQPDQSETALQAKKAPKAGYPNPFIPPTKGNGF